MSILTTAMTNEDVLRSSAAILMCQVVSQTSVLFSDLRIGGLGECIPRPHVCIMKPYHNRTKVAAQSFYFSNIICYGAAIAMLLTTIWPSAQRPTSIAMTPPALSSTDMV